MCQMQKITKASAIFGWNSRGIFTRLLVMPEKEKRKEKKGCRVEANGARNFGRCFRIVEVVAKFVRATAVKG